MAPRVVREIRDRVPGRLRSYFTLVAGLAFQAAPAAYASVSYGPLLFALPIPTWIQTRPQKTPDGDSPWIPTPRAGGDIQVERRPCLRIGTAAGRPGRVDAPARNFDLETDDAQLARPAGDGDRVETIRLVP